MATPTPEDQPRSQPSVEPTRSYENKTEATLGHSHDAAPGPTAPVDSEKGAGSADGDDDKAEEGDYATGLKLFILMTSLLLCQFLVALDMVSLPLASSPYSSLP